MRIIILGGGPCGLGAAWRLCELGHTDFVVCEKNNYWGGLSASFKDTQGFWWDLGGHVLFSHYRYFDQAMDKIMGSEKNWLYHNREAWIWMQDRFIPYPLQNNIHHLPLEIYWECLEGIIDINGIRGTGMPTNFKEWIEKKFGDGLAKWFLKPYNFKVWAYPPAELDWGWVGERVSRVDLKQIMKQAIFKQDNRSWGPNSQFRFPQHGGTGKIWRTLAKQLPSDQIFLERECSKLDLKNRKVHFCNGQTLEYDRLLSTIPLTTLVKLAGPDTELGPAPLKSSSTHIIGLALKGMIPDHLATKCWIYFPEKNCPFYRVTVFSNYSPNNVPNNQFWSLMCEVSSSPVKPIKKENLLEDVIHGAIHTKLIEGAHQIDHTWSHTIDQGYPTPDLSRNTYLFPLLKKLKEMNVYTRGRFGAWQYEIGNMDHTFMQGVEFAETVLSKGSEFTLEHPQLINEMNFK